MIPIKFLKRCLPFFLIIALLGGGEKGICDSKKAPSKGILQDATSFVLSNGMKFIVVPQHRAPVVVMYLVYKKGAADDPMGKSGVAHLLEHLMFKGTKKYPDGEFKKIIARNGGNQNAMTSMDMTCYQVVIASDRLEEVMKLEADRMVNLAPSDEATAPELKVMLEEYQMRIGDNPDGQMHQASLAALFWNHPYRRHPAGWKSEILSLTKADALDFYHKWYAPNNAWCVIVGDIGVEKAKSLAETYFGSLPPKELPQLFSPAEPSHFNETTRLTLRHERLSSAQVSLIYGIPDIFQKQKDKEYALEILAEILGGGSQSRLSQALEEEQKIVPPSGVKATYVRMADPLGFIISAHPLYLTDLPNLEMALDGEVRRLLARGVTEEELKKAKEHLILEFNKSQDDLSSVASLLVQEITNGAQLEDIKAYKERIQKVTLQDVKEVSTLIFQTDPRVIQVMLPLKKRESVS
jgi:zinc protease